MKKLLAKFLKWLFKKKVIYTYHHVNDGVCISCGKKILLPASFDRIVIIYISNTTPEIITDQLGSGEADEIFYCS